MNFETTLHAVIANSMKTAGPYKLTILTTDEARQQYSASNNTQLLLLRTYYKQIDYKDKINVTRL